MRRSEDIRTMALYRGYKKPLLESLDTTAKRNAYCTAFQRPERIKAVRTLLRASEHLDRRDDARSIRGDNEARLLCLQAAHILSDLVWTYDGSRALEIARDIVRLEF